MDNQLALGFFKATAASSYLRYLASGAFSLSSPSQQDALVLVSLGMIAVGVFPCSAPSHFSNESPANAYKYRIWDPDGANFKEELLTMVTVDVCSIYYRLAMFALLELAHGIGLLAIFMITWVLLVWTVAGINTEPMASAGILPHHDIVMISISSALTLMVYDQLFEPVAVLSSYLEWAYWLRLIQAFVATSLIAASAADLLAMPGQSFVIAAIIIYLVFLLFFSVIGYKALYSVCIEMRRVRIDQRKKFFAMFDMMIAKKKAAAAKKQEESEKKSAEQATGDKKEGGV